MEEERQKGGPRGETHSRDAPAFLRVPPVWMNSLALGRHKAKSSGARSC